MQETQTIRPFLGSKRIASLALKTRGQNWTQYQYLLLMITRIIF
jgi:hypothetical protein